MSGTDIFLSYARQDRGTARMFAERLAEEGFNVWWDASLRSGQTFDEVIERNLRDAKAVVVLWSPASVASRWVRAEATLADRRNKLAPAIIQACDRPIIFELTHTADLADWTGDTSDPRWRAFVSDLGGLMEAANDQAQVAKQADEPAPRPAPASRQLLRPGNDEVIFADRDRRAPVQQSNPVEPIAKESAAAAEIHCLEVEEDGVAQEPIVVDPLGVKIGRTAPADVVLAHASVSREHCIVGIANDELLVTDLNSTNGTYVDGIRISRATILPVGSVLRVGQVSLLHTIRPGAPAQRSSRAGLSNVDQRPAGRLAAAS